MGFKFYDPLVRSLDFLIFILELINENDTLKDNLANLVFVINNCIVNKPRATKFFINEFLDIIYLPPYCPFLNPIKKLLGYWK